MHAVMVKFASTVALTDLRGFFEDQRSVLHSVEGLLGTTWTADEDILGGFLLFSDQAAAEAYLRSDVFDAMLLNASFEHFRVQHCHVVDHSDQRDAVVKDEVSDTSRHREFLRHVHWRAGVTRVPTTVDR